MHGFSSDLWYSHLLPLLRALLGVGTCRVLTEGDKGVHPGLVNGLEVELGAQEVADCPQGSAHVRR